MTCSNTHCPVFIVCQKKHKPCQSSTSRVLQNGYRAMAMQEQKMRMSSIDYFIPNTGPARSLMQEQKMRMSSIDYRGNF